MIFIEDLAIKNMTATAKGDTENPGRNVRAKAGIESGNFSAWLGQS